MVLTYTIYRVTNAGDVLENPGGGEQAVAAGEKVILNDDIDDLTTAHGYIIDDNLDSARALSESEAVEADGGDIQDLGEEPDLYYFKILVTRADLGGAGGANQIIRKLKDIFKREPQTNDNFKHGRIGIKIDDFPDGVLKPVGTGTSQVGGLIRRVRITKTRIPTNRLLEIWIKRDTGDDD